MIVASAYNMFHWMLVTPQKLKSVVPVKDSFSNMEMRTFSHIRTHQSTSETFNTSLWRRKAKPASVHYFAIVVLVRNKIYGTFPQQVSVSSVLWNWSIWDPVLQSFSVGLILKPQEGWIVTSSMTPRQTNRPKRVLTSMCMEVTYKCCLLGLSLLLALADFAHM